MAWGKINFNFVERVIEINEENNAAYRRQSAAASKRLKSVPDDWEMLTENSRVQSFRDDSGRIRFFSVSTEKEIHDDTLV